MTAHLDSDPRNQRLQSQRGAILFIVAAGLVVFIGFAGLALDLGMLYNVKTDLQNGMDAAALAGAAKLNGTTAGINAAVTEAMTAANRYHFYNTPIGLAANQVTFSTVRDSGYVQAASVANPAAIRFVRTEISKTMDLALIKIIPGAGSTRDVSAFAVAGKTPPVTAACDGLSPLSPAPIINEDGTPGQYQVGVVYDLRFAGGQDDITVGSGNFLILDFSPVIGGNSGGAAVRDLLYGGADGCVTLGAPICSKPGVTQGPVRQGLNDRFDEDLNTTEYDQTTHPHPVYDDGSSTGHSHYLTGSYNSRRILPVPLVSSTYPAYSVIQNGRDCPIYVFGFGCFLIRERIPNGNTTVRGEFIGNCHLGGLSDPGTPPPVTGLPSLTDIVLYR